MISLMGNRISQEVRPVGGPMEPGFKPGHFASSPIALDLSYMVKRGPLEGKECFFKNVLNYIDYNLHSQGII